MNNGWLTGCVKNNIDIIAGKTDIRILRFHNEFIHKFRCSMKTGKFSTEEMDKIAEVLEAEYFFGFQFKDGTKI